MRWLTTRYDLALRRPWPGLGVRRRGWIIRVTRDGVTGFGDCAPLPLLGRNGFVQATACAFETALCDRAARAAGVSLARWLNPGAADRVRVNAVFPGSAGASPAPAAGRSQVVKLKLPGDIDEALRRIERAGTATLRLDANRGFSFDDAATLLRAIASLPIDHVEEPLRDPTLSTLLALQAMVPFPIAIDESLDELGVEAVLSSGLRRIVVKPMLLGGPLRTLEIAGRAEAAGVEVVVTTAMDSAVGAWMAAHVAAAVGNGLAHGLDTSRWLAEDVAPGPEPVAGWLDIPDRPGLGVEP